MVPSKFQTTSRLQMDVENNHGTSIQKYLLSLVRCCGFHLLLRFPGSTCLWKDLALGVHRPGWFHVDGMCLNAQNHNNQVMKRIEISLNHTFICHQLISKTSQVNRQQFIFHHAKLSKPNLATKSQGEILIWHLVDGMSILHQSSLNYGHESIGAWHHRLWDPPEGTCALSRKLLKFSSQMATNAWDVAVNMFSQSDCPVRFPNCLSEALFTFDSLPEQLQTLLGGNRFFETTWRTPL